MLCYWGLDSAIERGTIKASNLPGNRCCAGMSSLCSMWENFFPWKNPPPFLFLCARGHNPDPKHGHHCDPKTRDCPIKSLPLLVFFLEEGHVWRHCHPSLERFIRHNTRVYQFDKYIVNDYYILLLQYTMVFTKLLQRIPWYILSLLS